MNSLCSSSSFIFLVIIIVDPFSCLSLFFFLFFFFLFLFLLSSVALLEMTSSAVKNNFLPPGLVSNLQDVLRARKGGSENEEQAAAESNNRGNESAEPSSSASNSDTVPDLDTSKPLLLVTNSDGIESPGLTYLVDALVRQGRYSVHVCAPQSLVLFSFFFLLKTKKDFFFNI